MDNNNLIDLRRRTVIDGVTILYTGGYEYIHQGYCRRSDGGYEDLGFKLVEEVEYYDQIGNRFYSNFETEEAARKEIEELAERGITAVIGPKAPYRTSDGTIHPNPHDYIGVYIVKPPVKKLGHI